MAIHPADSSAMLKAHIKASEGKSNTAYFDAAGVPTAGYGHIKGITADHVRTGAFFNDATIDKWFEEDLDEAERAVRELVTVPLNQPMFDALVDFVFNLGRGAFAKSTLLRKLNAGDYDAVPEQLLRWNKAKDPANGNKLRELRGLTIRRQWEADLFRSGLGAGAPPSVQPSPDMTTSPAPTAANTPWWVVLLNFVLSLLFGGRRG